MSTSEVAKSSKAAARRGSPRRCWRHGGEVQDGGGSGEVRDGGGAQNSWQLTCPRWLKAVPGGYLTRKERISFRACSVIPNTHGLDGIGKNCEDV
jgi:hypothetical protein